MHPYNDSKERSIMVVFNIIVDFLNEYDLRPSKKLYDEYAQSELTKKLNTLPSRVYLNSKFDKSHQMSEEVYEKLRKRFYS